MRLLAAHTGGSSGGSGGGQCQLRPPAAFTQPSTALLQLLGRSPSKTAAAGSVVKRAVHRIVAVVA